ncbi:MAG: ComF family protein [Patescibacteria group bacterium]
MSLFDILFPKRCVSCSAYGFYICSNCFAKITLLETSVCVSCQKNTIGGMTHPHCYTPQMIDGVLSSVVYRGVVKKLVYRFKYKPYLSDLEQTIVSLFYEGLIQQEAFFRLLQHEVLLVPIPLHISRFRMRGYNQSQILARGIGKRLHVPVADILTRVRNTQTQIGQTKAERDENMKGAFGLKKGIQIPSNVSILLVDDVCTSGATLKEAAKVLKRTGVKTVWGITFAHGE